jgi:hypothetical protein
MLGWIYEKMATQKSTIGGGKFFASGLTNPCATGGDCSTAAGNSSWDNACTSDLSSRGEKLGKGPSTLVQHAQCTNGSSDG